MSKKNGWSGTNATKAREFIKTLMTETWADGEQVICPRCLTAIFPGDAWDVGHEVDIKEDSHRTWDPTGWRAEHSSCNRKAGANLTNQMSKAQRERTRPW